MKRFFFIAVFILLTQSLSYAGPFAHFDEFEHDLGNISNEDKVEYAFGFSNTGDEDLLIQKLVVSSGTIRAVASSGLLRPGEKGSISVTVDMRGKRGIYSKKIDVYTNDPATPVTTLTVKISVKDRIHMNQYEAAQVFSGDCRGCHVDQGKGKKGWDLFKADCFMCHNAGKNTSLSTMSKKTANELLKAIREGIPSTLMPGFDLQKGGPLDDAEINSLIDLITH